MKYLFVSSSLFLIAACGGTSPKETAKPVVEAPVVEAPVCEEDSAGSSLETAQALPIGKHQGCLLTTADFYSFRAPDHAAGTAFNVSVKGESGLSVTLFDAQKNELKTSTEGDMHVAVAGGTDVMLRISRDESSVASAYSFELNATPLVDTDEPNDTLEQAKPLNMGQIQDGLLQTLANKEEAANDYYRVLVGRRGMLSVQVTPGTDELSMHVVLLDLKGAEIESTQSANAGGAASLSARVRTGEYMIRIAPAESSPERSVAAGEAPRYWSEPYSIVVEVK